MIWVVIAIVLWVAVIVAVETGLVARLASPLEPASPDVRLDLAASVSEPIGPYGWCEDFVRPDWVREYEETRP